MNERHYCLSETRPEGLVGLKLAVASLSRNDPHARIHIFADTLGPEVARWLDRWPNVRRHTTPAVAAAGWNAKPALLRAVLGSGASSVTWVDTDVILLQPLAPLLDVQPPGVLICTEEYFRFRYRGVACRTRAWDMAVARDFPFTVNTCILRVDDAHLPLLDAWQDFTLSSDYAAWQARSSSERPFHAVGDQDLLGALLGSADFSDVPVVALRRGRDIAQCFKADGFSPSERISTLWHGAPALVHAQGPKPWAADSDAPLYLRLSPYRYIAREYDDVLDPAESGWLQTRGADARFLERLALRNPMLAGLLPAVAALAIKRMRSMKNVLLGRLGG